MEQGKPTLEGQSSLPSTTSTPLAWMRRTAPYSPERRAKMLEHMARARSVPRLQTDFAPTAPVPSGSSAKDIVGDLIGNIVLFGVAGLLFQSRVPLYFGAFLFLTDGERIERALASIGIRLEPETIGPDIVKRSVFWFGWFALLDALKGSVPVWLAPWMPPTESWSSMAGFALLLGIVEASTALALRRALPRLGWEIRPDGPTWRTIQLAVAVAAVTLLVLSGPR